MRFAWSMVGCYQAARGRLLPPEGASLDFSSVSFRPTDFELTLVTSWGDTLNVEVVSEEEEFTRRRGRAVVYLDQNKWVQIALALRRPDRARAELDRLQPVALCVGVLRQADETAEVRHEVLRPGNLTLDAA